MCHNFKEFNIKATFFLGDTIVTNIILSFLAFNE